MTDEAPTPERPQPDRPQPDRPQPPEQSQGYGPEIAARRERLNSLRQQVLDEQTANAQKMADRQAQLTLAQYDQEEARLEAQLESVKAVGVTLDQQATVPQLAPDGTGLAETLPSTEREAAAAGEPPSSDYDATVANAGEVGRATKAAMEGQTGGEYEAPMGTIAPSGGSAPPAFDATQTTTPSSETVAAASMADPNVPTPVAPDAESTPPAPEMGTRTTRRR